MSIMIKGMEMPKTCKECPFSDHEAWCLIPGDWRERYYMPKDERSKYCPLIELPPHGRLIDADALEKFLADAEMEETRRRKYVLAGALNTIQGNLRNFPTTEPEPHWIPCSERLPDEDHWLGGSGKQFSDEVLVSVSNSADEDVYVYVSQTLDGKWNLELPEYYEVIAWMPLPSPYQTEEE